MGSIHIDGGVSSVTIDGNVVTKTYKIKHDVLKPCEYGCITKEVAILNLLGGYKGFPQLIDIQIKPCEYSLVMPYLGKTLYKHKYTRDIFIQILRKVAILHKHNIVHFDIKPPNICIDDNNKISIIDFSHSILTLDYEIHVHTCCGTYTYMPPEVFRKKTYKLTSAIDIWSIGCVLYELITKKCCLILMKKPSE